MATGSLSTISKDPQSFPSFKITREENPNGIIFTNLSANANPDRATNATSSLKANVLKLHANAVQELIMPEGDRDFNWLDNIQYLVSELEVPTIVKEVGFGMSKTMIAKLQTHDARLIDVSGRGGANFAVIESRRNHDIDSESLLNWGQTTPEPLLEAHLIRRGETETTTPGGITFPLDAIKAGVLGVRAVGVAGYLFDILQNEGYEALGQTLDE